MGEEKKKKKKKQDWKVGDRLFMLSGSSKTIGNVVSGDSGLKEMKSEKVEGWIGLGRTEV